MGHLDADGDANALANGYTMIRAFLLVFLALVLWLWAMLTSSAHAAVLQDGPDDAMTCGTWTYYAPDVMQRVRGVRGLDACEDCAGMAATVDQRHIGQRIEVWFDGAWRGVYHVVDVGQPGRNREGLVGEVDFETAMRWQRAGPWWGCYRVVS